MPTPSTRRQPRRRDAASTRSEILVAATRLFAERSYEEIGLREIVAEVGVDAALIKRYFGSKEGLYAEVIEIANGARGTLGFFDGKRDEVAEKLARFVTDIDSDDEHRKANLLSIMLVLRATHSQRTSPMLRANMEEEVLRPLAEWLGGEHAAERAVLITAYLTGLSVMQRLVKPKVFDHGDLNIIVDYVTSAVQTCINGKLAAPAKAARARAPKGK